ncbi:MAG: SMP-30/gluconolactonase/LRE family protein [Comamonas sp.]
MPPAPLRAECLVHAHDTVGESPVWSPAEQALWWTDIEGRRIHRLAWADRSVQSWALAEQAGCIGLHHAGGLVAGMASGIFHLHPRPDGRVQAKCLHQAAHGQDDMRFNDGRVDRAGRFWSTTMVRDMARTAPAGKLYLSAAGHTRELLAGFITPNGTAFSPDGRVFYISDSHPSVQKVWAFDVDANGSLHNRRVFIDMTAYPGRPDGATVDADGCYWICGNDAGLVHRFTPQGRLDRSVQVPVDKPAMCAFAGPGLDTLVITSIRPAQPPAAQAELAGAVFAVVPGVKGLPEQAFAG